MPRGIPYIVGNEADLCHVVTAILTNALEAVERSGMRGKITVTTYADDEGATLRVSDNGAGIEPELLPKVCEPFVTTKPREPGSGLGDRHALDEVDRQRTAGRPPGDLGEPP